jgi:Na+/H+ antiporter NhaD/arsenite permease-like protein
MIGSTANIVSLGILERRRHIYMKFGWWIKIGFLVVVVAVALAGLLLLAQIA